VRVKLTTSQSACRVRQGAVKRDRFHLKQKAPQNGGTEAPATRSGFFTAVLRRRRSAFALALVLALSHHGTYAAMQLGRTRLVVNEGDGNASIQLHSEDRLPLLLQTWVERDGQHADGQEEEQDAQAHTASSPPQADFITSPPVMRLEPGRSRVLRVWRVKAPDAAAMSEPERESLYWLNVLEIPATVETADKASDTAPRLHTRVKTRIKLFYRPQALAHYSALGVPGRDEQLRFSAGHDADGHLWLTIANPAPIHQSLARLTLHPSARNASPEARPVELDTPMLAPFARLRLDLPSTVARGAGTLTAARLTFAIINDNGNLVEAEQTL